MTSAAVLKKLGKGSIVYVFSPDEQQYVCATVKKIDNSRSAPHYLVYEHGDKHWTDLKYHQQFYFGLLNESEIEHNYLRTIYEPRFPLRFLFGCVVDRSWGQAWWQFLILVLHKSPRVRTCPVHFPSLLVDT